MPLERRLAWNDNQKPASCKHSVVISCTSCKSRQLLPKLQNLPVSLDSVFTSRGDYTVYRVAIVYFISHLTRKDNPRLQMAQSFLQEVLPHKPDMILGDLNNLASLARCKVGGVHPRNGLSTLYLEEMMLAATPRITLK